MQDLLRDRVSPTDADLASDQALDDWLMHNIGTSHHVSGTCKMGPAADPMAVVDQYGRVHGLDNLRIADASIMPDCIRANTNATTDYDRGARGRFSQNGDVAWRPEPAHFQVGQRALSLLSAPGEWVKQVREPT